MSLAWVDLTAFLWSCYTFPASGIYGPNYNKWRCSACNLIIQLDHNKEGGSPNKKVNTFFFFLKAHKSSVLPFQQFLILLPRMYSAPNEGGFTAVPGFNKKKEKASRSRMWVKIKRKYNGSLLSLTVSGGKSNGFAPFNLITSVRPFTWLFPARYRFGNPGVFNRVIPFYFRETTSEI